MELNEQEKERYTRHLQLSEIGVEGQEKLKEARVLVVGGGGLGSPVLLYLTAAGVGHIGLVDDDRVAASNLHRQVLYDTDSVGLSKVQVATRTLTSLNPFCRITPHEGRLTEENADTLVGSHDVVVDATDNLTARYLMDEVCSRHRRPLVHGSVRGWQGQISVFHYRGGPSYRDLFPYDESIHRYKQPLGLPGTVPGVVGTLQANEVIKIILGRQEVLSGKLLMLDLLVPRFTIIALRRGVAKEPEST
ncbi:MAG: HesA/MoeB/ThiF family protein [Odoribacteraceae bacterium]|jgi:adenylyltransferase/sulfurtransferase|nr:HesA/MoeB/ThiF family protein [Odoribacteraceae bacterium]